MRSQIFQNISCCRVSWNPRFSGWAKEGRAEDANRGLVATIWANNTWACSLEKVWAALVVQGVLRVFSELCGSERKLTAPAPLLCPLEINPAWREAGDSSTRCVFIPHVAFYQCLITQKLCKENHENVTPRKITVTEKKRNEQWLMQ